jgi:lipopolysaccharide transport system permease protein
MDSAEILAAKKEFSGMDKLHVIRSDERSFFSDFQELWQYRELLILLAWRDVKVRYKQTYLGIAWAILQPIMTMIIFSVIFGRLANLPSEGVPYPLYTFSALLPWQLFSFALSASSNSLVGNERIIAKVYFPRLILPLSSVLVGIVDFIFAFGVFLLLMLIYQIPLTLRMLLIPFLVFLVVLTALSVGFWLSAINVKYRDVRYMIPFITQIWLYASPIAYSSTLIPANWKWLYGLNPMVGVIEGFRWALLGLDNISNGLILISIGLVVLILIGGINYFKKMEDLFADVL